MKLSKSAALSVFMMAAMAGLTTEGRAAVKCPTSISAYVTAPSSGGAGETRNQSFVRGEASLGSNQARCRLVGQRPFTTISPRTGASCGRFQVVLNLQGPAGWTFEGNTTIRRLRTVQGSAITHNGRAACFFTDTLTDPVIVRPQGNIFCANQKRDGFIQRGDTTPCPGPK